MYTIHRLLMIYIVYAMPSLVFDVKEKLYNTQGVIGLF